MEENGSLWKIYIITENVTSKIQTGMEKSKFHLFVFFCENWTEVGQTKIYRRCKGMLVIFEDCGHGPVGGCCFKLLMGVTYNQTGKSCFKIRPAGPDFYGLWNNRNNDGEGGAGVHCAVRWEPVTAQDT